MFEGMTPQDLSFEAEIVAIFEKDGRRIAKILVHSFSLDIDARDLGDAHLGDKVNFVSGDWSTATEN
jgi:hypothetical protein